MEIVKGILVVLHILSFGIVMGSAVAQIPAVRAGAAKISKGIMHGSLGLLVTGLALVGMIYALGGSPNNAKIGAKTLVLLAIIAVVFINRKKETVTPGTLGLIAGLSSLNVALAVLWH